MRDPRLDENLEDRVARALLCRRRDSLFPSPWPAGSRHAAALALASLLRLRTSVLLFYGFSVSEKEAREALPCGQGGHCGAREWHAGGMEFTPATTTGATAAVFERRAIRHSLTRMPLSLMARSSCPALRLNPALQPTRPRAHAFWPTRARIRPAPGRTRSLLSLCTSPVDASSVLTSDRY